MKRSHVTLIAPTRCDLRRSYSMFVREAIVTQASGVAVTAVCQVRPKPRVGDVAHLRHVMVSERD